MKKVGIIVMCDFIDYPIGGEVSFINTILKNKYDENLEISLIGLSHNLTENKGVWIDKNINNLQYKFFPLFIESKEKNKTKIPFRLRMVMNLRKYRKIILKEDFDLIYIHCAELIIPLYSQQRHHKFKIIYHVHGEPEDTLSVSRFKPFRLKIFKGMYKKIVSTAIKYSHRVIWVSSRGRENFYKTNFDSNKNIVIPTPYDEDLIAPIIEGSSDEDMEKTIIFVGRIAKVKNLELLLEAFKLVILKGEKVKLLICGDGEELKNIKAKAEKDNLAGLIEFKGRVSRSELSKYLSRAAVFVMTSTSEGSPVCVIEALSFGIPVVCSNVGDLKEYVINGYNGFVVEDFEANSFADKILEVLDQGRQAYKDNCLKVGNLRSSKIIAEKIYSVFENL